MMAVFTPRGLKLRLPTAYAFALMARLYPRVDAFRILQSTEVVENLGKLVSFMSGIVAFSLGLEPLRIAVLVFVAVSIIQVVRLFGLFIPPITFLLPISRVFGFLSGYGVLLVGLLVFGLVTSGWTGVAAFLVGRLAGGAIFGIVNMQYSSYVYRKTGIFISSSERSFFHAYRLEADRIGASTNLNVADSELTRANWEPVLVDLAVKGRWSWRASPKIDS